MSTSTLADPLSERLRRALPAEQAYTPADWNVDVLPSPVDHYLRHLLRHQHKREARRLRRARTDWVNYDHPNMEEATRTFLDAATDHMQVPREAWTETLQTAIHRTADYLVRPVPTLRAFVFEDSTGPVPTSTVEWRMRFFKPYSYLRNAVAAYAEKRDQDAFEADSFERLLRRVDERMTDDFPPERWLRLLAPFFETADCATGNKQIPLVLLRTFFEEKDASHLTDRLAAVGQEQDTDAIAPDTLRRLLDTTSPESPSSPTASLPTDLSGPTDNASSPSPDASSAEAPAEDNPDGATPMWKQFEQEHSRRSTEVQDNNDQEAQPLWTQFQSQPSSSPANSSPGSTSSTPDTSPSERSSGPSSDTSLSALEREVFGSAPPPKRQVYVQELFDGDDEAYRQILKRLRSTESWSTASQIIASDVFRAHDVNIYSDPAVHFTNAVEAGYKEE